MDDEDLETYEIKRSPQKCTPLIGSNLSHRLARILKEERVARVAIITDSGVPLHFVNGFYTSLRGMGMDSEVLTIDAGEASKHVDNLPKDVKWLTSRGFGRKDYILGVGGGVVTDIAGALAAGLGRGAGLISAPTTLLGMVDAGWGGKAGFDTDDGKNLYGAIYQPRWVVADMDALQTLPDKAIRSGISEAIKTGVIRSDDLFEFIGRHARQILEKNSEFLERVVKECAKYKMLTVQQDPEEKLGVREDLNFGHTVAHGIEKVTGFKIDHGYAVSIGMIAEAEFARECGFNEQNRLRMALEAYGLPTTISRGLSIGEIIEATKSDKKNVYSDGRKRVKCSLPIQIGEMHPLHSVIVEEDEMRRVLERMVEG